MCAMWKGPTLIHSGYGRRLQEAGARWNRHWRAVRLKERSQDLGIYSSVTLLLKTTYQVATVSMETFLSSENITVYSNLLYVIRQKLKLSKTKFYYCVST